MISPPEHHAIPIALIGTYTQRLPHVDGRAAGILSLGSGGSVELVALMENPSWVTSSRDGRFVYAVSETTEFDGQASGSVAAYEVVAGSIGLMPRGSVSSQGLQPCHAVIDPSSRFLVVSNYGSGSFAVFRIQDDGSLSAALSLVEPPTSSDGRSGTVPSHIHQVVFDPRTGLMAVVDLGTDRVRFHKLDGAGSISDSGIGDVVCAPRAGPRHIAFEGEYLFVLHEFTHAVGIHRWDGSRFQWLEDVGTLVGADSNSTAAEILVTASGTHVITTHRGVDLMCLFEFDRSSGTLALRDQQPSAGRSPRSATQSPDGQTILVSNQDSDTVAVFQLDEEAQTLTHVRSHSALTPTCIQFLRTV